MIGQALLGEIIGADALGTVAAADLTAPIFGAGIIALYPGIIE